MWYGFGDVKAQARKDSACQDHFLGSVTRGAAPSQGNGDKCLTVVLATSWLDKCHGSSVGYFGGRGKNAAVGKSGWQCSN